MNRNWMSLSVLEWWEFIKTTRRFIKLYPIDRSQRSCPMILILQFPDRFLKPAAHERIRLRQISFLTDSISPIPSCAGSYTLEIGHFWREGNYLTCLIFLVSRDRFHSVCGGRTHFAYDFSRIRMRELVADAVLDDKLVDLWPEYQCLYDVRSPDFKKI